MLSHPLRSTTHFSSSSQTPPPPPPSTPSSPSTPPSQTQISIASPQLSTSSPGQPTPVSVEVQKRKLVTSKVETTDWIASTLTRQFGLGAGLAWAAFLAFGVVSEQVKTRLEVSQQEANTRYIELRVGGGASPRPGDLVVIDLKGKIQESGQVFVDTFGGVKKKPLALVMGSRPYSKGMCEGIELALRSMKAGGKRKVSVPSNLGFGENGADFGYGVQIPPLATRVHC